MGTNDLKRDISNLENEIEKLRERLDNGRRYLMTVESNKISVGECLIAFGWNENGF